MSERFCFNCNFKCQSDDTFCQECGVPLDLSDYINSKKVSKNIKDKIKSIFGNNRIDEINSEIEEFINLSITFNDFEDNLKSLKSRKYDEYKFKDKYGKIKKLYDFKYLNEISKDEYLNKKLLK